MCWRSSNSPSGALALRPTAAAHTPSMQALDVAHQRLCLYAVGTEDFAPLHEEASEAEQQEGEQRATSKGSSRTSSKAAGPPQKAQQQQQQQQQQQGGGGEDVVYPALVRHALRTTGKHREAQGRGGPALISPLPLPVQSSHLAHLAHWMGQHLVLLDTHLWPRCRCRSG